MKKVFYGDIPKSPRIDRMIQHLYAKLPVIEADRAEIVTRVYKETEQDPVIIRRAKVFKAICEELPIIIRPEELIVGSNSQAPRGCQVFPEYSFTWVEDEFDTVETREADPFYISEDTKKRLHEVYKYWPGKTNSELAMSYMAEETKIAMKHNMFTTGNYFYNGIGHFCVHYDWVINEGIQGIKQRVYDQLEQIHVYDGDYATRKAFLDAVLMCCDAVVVYAHRYAELAKAEAEKCLDADRKQELLAIADNCMNVPEKPATSFYEACQSFWFVQMLIQTESSGHSISPGRFDQYMYPFYEKDVQTGKITREKAQELLDCIWIKLNDLNKVRDAASAQGFAGYSLFQNLIVGGQDIYGQDATNDLSAMCLEASLHVLLPAPSLSIRVWNGTPNDLMVKAARVTRTGIGLPAYYNDEVIIPSMLSRGVTLEDARNYCIIGCVEPQAPGKTDGWHDAAFFNMCRPLEMVFSNGYEFGERVGLQTGQLKDFDTFDKFYDAYKAQMEYFIQLMVNSDNSIDVAHGQRTPLPFQSCLVEDCIARGKALQQGGAHYNFTGPQGFGIANMTDALYAIKKLVYEDKKVTLEEYAKALEDNFGKGLSKERAGYLTTLVAKELAAEGKTVGEERSGLSTSRSGTIPFPRKTRRNTISC